jgi:hypothetical protein
VRIWRHWEDGAWSFRAAAEQPSADWHLASQRQLFQLATLATSLFLTKRSVQKLFTNPHKPDDQGDTRRVRR